MQKPFSVLSFGEIIWDVYPDHEDIGGAPLNFAAHAARNGAHAYLLSAIGGDERGTRALAQIRTLDVDTAYVQAADRQTGACIVTLSEQGVPRYEVLQDTAYDYITLPAFGADERFDLLAFGTLALRSTHNRTAIRALLAEKRHRLVFCDVNVRLPFCHKEALKLCLSSADILKISDEELPYVLEHTIGIACSDPLDACRHLSSHYANLSLILLTMGAQGSLAYDCRSKETVTANAVRVTPVSTVGAGDSFGATFAVHYLSGAPIKECLAHASRVAAFVVSRPEAVPPYDPADLNG